jgi:branched-subunit amino acid aminotransferase/4-amino-4-deoxychorismate lyase
MRSLDGKIVYFYEHLERLARSCRLLKLKLPARPIKLRSEIKKTICLSEARDNYVRLTVQDSGAGSRYAILVKEYKPYPARKFKTGFRAGIAFKRQDANFILAQIKITDREFYESAYREAKARGFDEAVILNSYGYVAEGTRSNIFMVRSRELFTPELDCACLDGITRKVVFGLAKISGINVFEARFTLEDLYGSDEAFLTNSLMGIMPLVSIENKKVGSGKAGKLTRCFIKKYHSLLK